MKQKKAERFELSILVDEPNKKVIIGDSRYPGTKKEFTGGIHVVAADADAQPPVYYVLTWGASADLGWALAQSFNDGWNLPFVRRLFGYFTTWINKFFVNLGDGYDLNDDQDLRELEKRIEDKEEDKKIFH